jgi:ubiquinone/menaquinone biosynthesis C-methylase UbiE
MSEARTPVIFDAAAAARLDDSYSTAAIREQRVRFRKVIAARPGEVGLDVGCGPGHLVCELAREVAPDGRLCAIDTSKDMLEWARQRAIRENVIDYVELRDGNAAQLDFDDGSFDFVTATQVYCFVTDITTAIREAARVLRKGGRLVILDTDWDFVTWHSTDRLKTHRMLQARAADYANAYLPRELPRLLKAAGLQLTSADAYTIIETECNKESFGEGVIEGVQKAAVLSGIAASEVDEWVQELRSRAACGDYYFCANRFIFSGVKR